VAEEGQPLRGVARPFREAFRQAETRAERPLLLDVERRVGLVENPLGGREGIGRLAGRAAGARWRREQRGSVAPRLGGIGRIGTIDGVSSGNGRTGLDAAQAADELGQRAPFGLDRGPPGGGQRDGGARAVVLEAPGQRDVSGVREDLEVPAKSTIGLAERVPQLGKAPLVLLAEQRQYAQPDALVHHVLDAQCRMIRHPMLPIRDNS
jgi:hypothetical protein